MSPVDWLDIGASITRLVAMVASPVVLLSGFRARRAGDTPTATLQVCLAIYLLILSGRP